MNLSSILNHSPDLNAYLKFARNNYENESRIVARVDGNKISTATKLSTSHQGSSGANSEATDFIGYKTFSGQEYHLSQDEQSTIVDHFNKALELKYGDAIAQLSFSANQKQAALEVGLGHQVVQEVIERAERYQHLMKEGERLKRDMNSSNPHEIPLFVLEDAKRYLQQAREHYPSEENRTPKFNEIVTHIETLLTEAEEKKEAKREQLDLKGPDITAQQKKIVNTNTNSSLESTELDSRSSGSKLHLSSQAKLDEKSQGKITMEDLRIAHQEHFAKSDAIDKANKEAEEKRDAAATKAAADVERNRTREGYRPGRF
jgi:hypothetical protein